MIGWLQDQFVQQWLRTLGWAGAVALIVHVLGALGSSASRRASASAVAVALGFVAGHVTVAGVPAFPPERWQWSVWLTCASLLLLFLEEAKGGQATLRLVLQLALVAALAWYVLRPSSTARAWSLRQRNVAFYGGSFAALGFLLLAELRLPKGPPWRGVVAFTLAAAGAVAVFADVSDVLARTTAGLVAALGVCSLIAVVQRDVPLGRTVATTASIAFGSLLLYLWSARQLSDVGALLLFGSWASALVPLPRDLPWTSFALSALLSGAPAALAWWFRT